MIDDRGILCLKSIVPNGRPREFVPMGVTSGLADQWSVEETKTRAHKHVPTWLAVLSCVASPLLKSYGSH